MGFLMLLLIIFAVFAVAGFGWRLVKR